MKAFRFLAVSALVSAVGSTTAVGQIAVDGVKDAAYGSALWTQSNPTLRDTGPGDVGCDPSDLGGTPGTVTTGMEWSIPLTSIGSPTGTIQMMVMLTSGGYDFLSNQMLPTLPQTSGNLGQTNNVNLQQVAGSQSASFDVSNTSASAPIIDGMLDAALYTQIAVQNARTSFGDNADATPGNSISGSELDGLYVAVNGGLLYVMVTGNIENNFNKFSLFIDSIAGGQQALAGDNPDVDFNGLNNMGERAEFFSRVDGQFGGPGSGLTFEAGFEADYWFAVGHGAGDGSGESFANFADINDADPMNRSGGFLGRFLPSNVGGTPDFGDNVADVRYTFDMSNVAGVQGGACQPGPASFDDNIFSNGSELDGFYAIIDGNNLCMMFTGNFLTNINSGLGDPQGGRKFHVFIDAIDNAGQNPLIELNSDINAGTLQGMSRASVFDTDGITFDSAFVPDYWLGMQTLGNPIGMSIDSSLLIADTGAFDPFDIFTQIYPGCFDKGFVLADGLPVSFDGPFTSATLSNWAPREAFDDQQAGATQPLTNLAVDLVRGIVDNSNTAGVTSASVAGAGAVTTGYELCIDLDELGWNGTDTIRVAAFHASEGGGGGTIIDNQVLGGLPASYDAVDVGDITMNGSTRGADGTDGPGVRFDLIAGDQFIVVPQSLPCPGDIADDFGSIGADGMVSFGDFLALLGVVGPCPGGTPGCVGDIADDFGTLGADGMVSFGDFLALLGLVGPCP